MRNIIISGGGLVNKGAQAMTLISICELKKRFPDHKIYLLAWNTSKAERERFSMYDLELLQVPPLKFAKAAHNPFYKVLFSARFKDAFGFVDSVYRNTDVFIDISGYALGSNWSSKVCNDYLDAIEHALAYDIPVYLLPQSFGPFAFAGEVGKKIDSRIRTLFPKIKLICAREEEGYRALQSIYGLKNNLILTKDLVLASRIEDYSAAFKTVPQGSLPDVAENSICVIPNVRIQDGSSENVELIYHTAIEAALAAGLTVYITYHSTQDRKLCTDLKARFAKQDAVILLDYDHSCMEFNELVKKFRFVIASRFHAIVHALKNGTPCIALGWAEKYVNLLSMFGQTQYMFDLRNGIDTLALQNAIHTMAHTYTKEKQTIQNNLPALQEQNVFDLVK